MVLVGASFRDHIKRADYWRWLSWGIYRGYIHSMYRWYRSRLVIFVIEVNAILIIFTNSPVSLSNMKATRV